MAYPGLEGSISLCYLANMGMVPCIIESGRLFDPDRTS